MITISPPPSPTLPNPHRPFLILTVYKTQGGDLLGIRKPQSFPGAGLRTRGLFCSAGVSESRWATRSMTANKGVVLPCRGIRKPLGHPEHDCEQGGCFTLPGYQKAAGSRWATRSMTANKGVVLPCRGIRKPLVHPKPGCEQGGCFVMPGYQESAGPLVAALRTRGLFCLVRVSESRWATRSRTANKGVVSPCRVVMKPLGYPEQNCEQGGCFVLSGCHEAARPPGADLRTRGLFYSVGISEIRLASRSRTANKGVVLSCQSVRNTLCHPEQDCEQGGCFALPGYQKAAGPPGA